MFRSRYSIATVTFWVALAASNFYFFVDLMRGPRISTVAIALFSTLPVLNLLMWGLHASLFGPARRRAFWIGFEVGGLTGMVALVIAARQLPTSAFAGYAKFLERFLCLVPGLKPYAATRDPVFMLLMVALWVLSMSLPILAIGTAVGLIARRGSRRLRRSSSAPIVEESTPC